MRKFSWQSLLILLWILFCTLASFVFTRQVMEPTGNLVAYMPLMTHSSDSTLYPKDDFVPLLVERTPTLFWGILGKGVPLDHPYGYLFALNILIRLCTVSIVYRMVRTLAKDWRAGMIGVFLFSGSMDTVLGGSDLYWSYISHTPFSVPFLLLALYCLYRKRWFTCFALTGLVYNIHLLNAAYFSLFLFFWTLYQFKALGWKCATKCWVLTGIFALPVLPQTISGILQSEVNPIWQMHILDYHRQLLSPYQLPFDSWLRFGGYLLLFLLMLRKSQSSEEKSIGKAMLAMWFSLYILGTLFIEWIPLPFFLKLQPFRATDIFLLLFFPWFAREIFRGFSQNLTCRVLHFGLLLLMLFFNLKTLQSLFKETLTLCFLILVLAKIRLEGFPERQNRITERRLYQALTWGSVLYTLFLLVTVNQWTVDRGLAQVVLGQDRLWFWTMGVFFIIGSYLVLLVKRPHSALPACPLKRITLYLVILLGIELLQLIAGVVTTELRQGGHPFYSRFHPLFFEAARWCRDHTPKDALFIIPPYRGGFRGEALRSVFVSWDEQVALMIAPDYIPEYDRRLRLLGIQPLEQEDPPRTWYPTREELILIRDEYGADYIVIESCKWLAFPLVYENPHYCVYQLR